MRFFSRLDRYILRELLPPFFVASIVVLTMFQVNLYIYLGKTLDLSKVPFKAVMQLIMYESPGYLLYTLPIGVALATSIGMSRIARESELTALRASGIRILRVMWPVALFGMAVGLLNFYVVDQISPRASKEKTKLRIEIGALGSSTNFQANMPLRLKQYTVSLGQVVRNKDETLTIHDVLLIERPQINKVTIISTRDGTYRQGIWSFTGGQVWTFDTGSDELLEATTKDEIVINEPIVVGELFNPSPNDEKSLSELRQLIANNRNVMNIRPLEIQYHVNLSVPMMCLIFALVCPIFSISLAKHGGFIGVLVSLVLVMLYYNVWVVSTQILGKISWIQPWQAAWIPNMMLLSLGLYGIRRLE